MFKFSLQTALDIRERVEKIKQKELAQKLAVEQKVKSAIELIQQNVSNADQTLNQSKLGKNFTVQQMQLLANYKTRMNRELNQHFQELEQARKEVVEKQTALIEASRNRKTLEILKEKEFKRKQKKQLQLEQKNMDEAAICTFLRQTTSI